MTKKTKTLIATAAIAGLITGSSARLFASSTDTGPSSPGLDIQKMACGGKDGCKGAHDCKGKNECKGKGGCKSGDNGCKGKNSCKGKGGCKSGAEKKEGETK